MRLSQTPIVLRVVAAIVGVLTSLRLGVGVFAWRAAEKLERPQFEIMRRLNDGVEVRHYLPYLVAETTVDSTAEGFRLVAGYIFGKNKARDKTIGSEKMAMTAPVRSSSGEKMAMTAPVRTAGMSGPVKVSFVLGSKYSKSTAPVPEDR